MERLLEAVKQHITATRPDSSMPPDSELLRALSIFMRQFEPRKSMAKVTKKIHRKNVSKALRALYRRYGRTVCTDGAHVWRVDVHRVLLWPVEIERRAINKITERPDDLEIPQGPWVNVKTRFGLRYVDKPNKLYFDVVDGALEIKKNLPAFSCEAFNGASFLFKDSNAEMCMAKTAVWFRFGGGLMMVVRRVEV